MRVRSVATLVRNCPRPRSAECSTHRYAAAPRTAASAAMTMRSRGARDAQSLRRTAFMASAP